jgi:hypothetical protein
LQMILKILLAKALRMKYSRFSRMNLAIKLSNL